MIYKMSNRTVSHREISKIKNIRSKVENKYETIISISSSSNFNSHLLNNSEWDIIKSDECKEMNKLYYGVAKNIKIKINIMTQ